LKRIGLGEGFVWFAREWECEGFGTSPIVGFFYSVALSLPMADKVDGAHVAVNVSLGV
jgi:hypothetical protein